jgi:hypothetical protein
MCSRPRKKTRKDIKPIPSAKENTIVSILLRTFRKLKTLSNLEPITNATEINNVNKISVVITNIGNTISNAAS